MQLGVAPHAGAWIETLICCCIKNRKLVAPHAGAWIETYVVTRFANKSIVAPHAGAWIETAKGLKASKPISGRPSRRGVD